MYDRGGMKTVQGMKQRRPIVRGTGLRNCSVPFGVVVGFTPFRGMGYTAWNGRDMNHPRGKF